MRKFILYAVLASAGALAAGCGDEESDPDHHDDHPGGGGAEATLAPKSGNTTLAGTALFTGGRGAAMATITLTGAPPGQHGVHIHETGDCSAADAASAGGHWNPTMQMHGAPGPMSHFGDMGNIEVKADGTGSLTAANTAWEIGTGTANDVVGKAVVVHAMPDDLVMQPAGNAGARIGCGVITAE